MVTLALSLMVMWLHGELSPYVPVPRRSHPICSRQNRSGPSVAGVPDHEIEAVVDGGTYRAAAAAERTSTC